MRRMMHHQNDADGIIPVQTDASWNAGRRIARQSGVDFHLFLGNFRLHQRNFGIIGMWYPKIPVQGKPVLGGNHSLTTVRCEMGDVSMSRA